MKTSRYTEAQIVAILRQVYQTFLNSFPTCFLSFPLRMLNVDARDRVAMNYKLFAPLDVDAFLHDPDVYLARENLC
jgi:hypothetical protein